MTAKLPDELRALLDQAAADLAAHGPPPARRRRGAQLANTTAASHGITAAAPVIPRLGETVEAWAAHVAGMRDALAPVGALEEELADRVALLTWRLRRAARAETAIVAAQVESRLFTDLEGLGDDLAPYKRAVPFESESHLARYEVTTHRLLLATLHELEAIQRRRAGDAQPLARLEVNAPSVGEG